MAYNPLMNTQAFTAIRIAPGDDVAVALRDLAPGDICCGHDFSLPAAQAVAAGHKVALRAIVPGERVCKYGAPIGVAAKAIARGEWVHTHNLRSDLGGVQAYQWRASPGGEVARASASFSGFMRADGRVGVRNGVWILPTVGCVNERAARIAAAARPFVHGSVDAVTAFSHPYGCSQMAEDQEAFRRALAALAGHPNAGGVLLLGLGCENSGIEQLRPYLGANPRLRTLVCQDVEDEIGEGVRLVRELIDEAARDVRETVDASRLVVGLKCGGSDGFSGITANPAIGACSDWIVGCGGTSVLTEVPEMFGAEEALFARCCNRETFEKAAAMVNGFKEYFLSNGMAVDENPSPGNRAGGITTLAEKALGCTQKSGTAPVCGVLAYGEAVRGNGLHLLCAPGNDLVSASALAFSGAQIVLFSTGRGTPLSGPVPTVKIASNSQIAARKPGWIDVDAGSVLRGETVAQAGERLFRHVLAVASGAPVKGEEGLSMAFWKRGVTL